ncbi:MAG TPA: threonine/serine dehydratase [candidate division Zixibacteria bacterium]|nr:threonine/serine dehydratase [candidate division Zixibacteria bacterium]
MSNTTHTATTCVTLAEIQQAHQRIAAVVVRTPLIRFFASESEGLPKEALYIKPESLQPIGSFKLRGAYNKIAQLSDAERARGVITYSSGNHAQGVAYAARALGAKAVIVMPRTAPRVKREATAALGAEIVEVGPGSDERHAKAEELAAKHGYVIIPPYNDAQIISGQGTVGLEIHADLPDADLVLVPVGGGGLSSGVATALKLSGSRAKVIGVEPELANDAQQSLRAGHVVSISAERASSTLADGLRTQSIGELNFQHLSRYLDGVVTVSEEEIRKAMRRMTLGARIVPEPSGAVTFAAWLYHRKELPGSRATVAVVSGGNTEPQLLCEILGDTLAK